MLNTITNQTFIDAGLGNDVLGVDDTNDLSGVGGAPKTKKISLEQGRHYDLVTSGILLQKFQAKLEALKTGTGNVRIFCVGDSTTVGKGSTSGADKWGSAWPAVFTKYLIKNGINATDAGFFCNGDGTNASAYNPRLVINTGWTGAATSLGGSLQKSTTTSSPIAYTPTEAWDTAKVWYATIPSAGTFSVDINGSGTITQSTNAANGVASITITGTLGINTLNINYVSGTNVFMMGAETWNSATNQVQVINCGWGGVTTLTIADATNAYGPINSLKAVAPDLTIFGTVINDWGTGSNLATFSTDVQNLITAAQVSGDCVWMISVPTSNLQVPITTQLPYVNAIRSICLANNVPVIDMYKRFQTYEISQPLGLYSDTVHPNGPGYELIGWDSFEVINPKGSGGNIGGIVDGSSAPAGYVGEIKTSTVAIGSATSLTTATDKTITSITLAPGDWDLWGNIGFIAASTTIPTQITGSINTTTNTQATSPNGGAFAQLAATLGTSTTSVLPVGTMRVNPTVQTTYYLVGTATFTVSTLTAYGSITARRRR